MIKYEEELNERQLEAVRHFEGPLLVLAGAGSGKTRVITYRIAHLIDVYKVNPSNILAMTFTNKAANEMKERVNKLLGENVSVFVSTFHSACAYFLRRYAYLLGYKNNYVIYDDDDSKRLIKQILRSFNQDDSQDNVYKYYSEISNRKDRGEEISSGEDEDLSFENKVISEYQRILLNSNAMDFSDLILNMVRILKNFEDVRDVLSRKYRFLLIDEFQDTNKIQMDLLLLLLKRHSNICVVGDDDQSIYRWRGATIENILGFDASFKQAKIVKLEQNYRSTGSIILAASELIKNNQKRHQKTLFTRKSMGENIIFYTAQNDIEEASFITNEILRHKNEKGRRFGDFSILVRTNAQMRVLEESLRIKNIQYEVIGGVKFYERKEIKDIISYLRVVSNPESKLDFERILNIPPRGFGEVTLLNLRELAEKKQISLLDAALLFPKTSNFAKYLKELSKEAMEVPAYQLTQKIIADISYKEYLMQYFKSDYNDRIANIDEFINSMIPRGEGDALTLSEFLEGITLMSDIDGAELSSQKVSLMTMHSAKGLEFPVVFIAGFEENIIPHFRSILDSDEIDEERRLLYVAITRAKEKLYISYARERFQANTPSGRRVSRFFDELPRGVLTFLPIGKIEQSTIFGSDVERHDNTYKVEYYPEFLRSENSEEESRYRIGMNVVHPKFGMGIIKKIEGNGEETKLLIYFEKYGYKKLLHSFVKIL